MELLTVYCWFGVPGGVGLDHVIIVIFHNDTLQTQYIFGQVTLQTRDILMHDKVPNIML